MKCSFCVKEGRRSKVRVGPTSTTLVGHTPYYDEDGVYHSHDLNIHTTEYWCSNGHSWTRSNLRKCPSCDYGYEEPTITQTNKHGGA